MSLFEDSVILRAGVWTAEVLPRFGMNMISLRANGKHVLREAADWRTLCESPFLYGIPLLFPANRTLDGRFSFKGKSYQLPLNEPALGNHLHGLMYNAPFTIVRASENEITAVFENSGERYPFPFRMQITDRLDEHGMTRSLALCNTGTLTMPYTLAFHTTFVEPELFSAEIGLRHERSDRFVPTGQTGALTETEQRYRTGLCPKGLAISGYYAADGQTARLDDLVLEMSAGFDQRVLFNGGSSQHFLCIEPQAGMVNGLNMPGGHKTLLPGEETSYSISIQKEAVT